MAWRSPLDWLRGRPRVADLVLAALLAAVTVTGLYTRPLAHGTFRAPDLVAVLLALLATLPVAARRARPAAALGLAGLATAAFSITGYWSAFVGLGLLCTLYTIAGHPAGSVRLGGAGFALVLVWVTLVLDPTDDSLTTYLANTLTLLVAYVVGRNVQTRRAYTAALEERARHAEEERESLAREAVQDERRRIARELHDVVAHNISVMGVLATGARRALARNPGGVDETLATIEETGRATLREMRHLLDVLRVDEEPEDSPTAPQPGVAALDVLVDQVREAGLPVVFAVEGAPRPLPPGVDLSAYRITQEALTNTLKHAGAATARVRLRYARDALLIDVDDDGRGAVPADGEGRGHGLVGMRERVALFGGSLRAGPRPGGGYRVAARLPFESSPALVDAVPPPATEPGATLVEGLR